MIKVTRLIFGDFIFKFHDDEIPGTPVQYKNHTEIYRSYVNKRPIWYKNCDDTELFTQKILDKEGLKQQSGTFMK